MDERLRFVARLLEGEKIAVLCREYDVSRKTGYKLFSRYKEQGYEGLTDRSRRPYRQGCRLPEAIEGLILSLKREHPSWVRRRYARNQTQSAGDPIACNQHRTRSTASARSGEPAAAAS